ncbi:hypothetical protein [Amycolatopsis methanolica]|uniref:NAD-dependent epimerase/dehydratase n=1 Tax=Amycolatopsis methanolica 239 TaxID=1068978 RepID=A0A076MNV3_AMYME|nr:hypothetical protein [Amycolatopsis methanolica]AIJ22319.1 NAD-dependent epimerase/dehydratase [Amycolatopsis methanolica 239]
MINPTGIFGPVLSPRLSTSTGLIKAMLEGTMPVVPRSYSGVVDVRDVADAHVRAMTAPSAAGERFLVSSGPAMSFAQIAELLGVPVREAPGEAEVPVIRTDKARTVEADRMIAWLHGTAPPGAVSSTMPAQRLELVTASNRMVASARKSSR